jgi:hypothetical protein
MIGWDQLLNVDRRHSGLLAIYRSQFRLTLRPSRLLLGRLFGDIHQYRLGGKVHTRIMKSKLHNEKNFMD